MDMDLLEKIYRQHYKKIYNYICFRINNHFDAEELVNTVFEKAMKGWSTYRPEQSPLEAWLVGIARNVVNDYLRSKKRKFFLPLDDILSLASPGSSPLEITLQKEEHRELIRAMAQLKDKERQVLSLRFATELKNNEIAKIMGISESNVGVIIHRGLKKLMKMLESEVGLVCKTVNL